MLIFELFAGMKEHQAEGSWTSAAPPPHFLLFPLNMLLHLYLDLRGHAASTKHINKIIPPKKKGQKLKLHATNMLWCEEYGIQQCRKMQFDLLPEHLVSLMIKLV